MIEKFYKILDANPSSWSDRLILADYYDEIGEPDYANGSRWQVEKEISADYDREGEDWFFGNLPFKVSQKYSRPYRLDKRYENLHGPKQVDADQWLASLLAKLNLI